MAILVKIVGMILIIGSVALFVDSLIKGEAGFSLLSVTLLSVGSLIYAIGRRAHIDESNYGNPRANKIYEQMGIVDLICPKCGEVYKSGMGGCPRCRHEKNIYYDE